ncbi:MAG: gamma-glutamyltransferase, partial [Nitrospinaceae bacterium]|nr:gamma-glutamyltransferase [Nitrospinaceae bacterium]NIR53766.1 gamma-glutamyltransferase [Nitrospinaceae bacterium]NIS84176.1 gamma-glutamyltransferase [Nitrospinaceae bacterium]NIT80982.1 gamma-glutamyltransferase [Nitrospinaceae bacterium]NIU43272.1 gamma-glutamyltransferase [Nitrospinaceae bacterium]
MNLNQIEGRFSPTDDGKCAWSPNGMVSTAFPEATQAGVEVLNAGGNAIDAACAAAFALCVCEPQASGIGGQSMVLLHTQDKNLALDGSSRVPSLAHLSRMEKEQRLTGYRATTVPSTPAVLGYMHFTYGRTSWRTVLEPSIRIAKEGYRITELQHRLQKRECDAFLEVPSQSGARYFLNDKKEPFAVGDKFVQGDLAQLLEFISENGVKEFYAGEPARQIEEDMKDNDGFLRYEDMALIPWPVLRKPIQRRYRGLSIHTLPPPAAGRTLLLIMLMLGNLPSKFLKERSSESYHFVAETFRKALLNRKERPYDPNIYPQLPQDKRILSLDFAKMLAQSIHDDMDPTLPMVDLFPAVSDTTHLSVMDKNGNAVAITQSIERVYGAHAAAKGLGFLYNNYMSALETKDPSHPYYLRPNAIPWSMSAPVIVFRRKQPWIVAGSPGSERIFSAVAQFLSHIIDGNLPISEAMAFPRIHCSIGGKLSYEEGRFEGGVMEYLKNVGYKMDPREPYAFYMGAIHAVMKTQTREGFQGVAEIRRDG